MLFFCGGIWMMTVKLVCTLDMPFLKLNLGSLDFIRELRYNFSGSHLNQHLEVRRK
jgi:hypothetical protein